MRAASRRPWLLTLSQSEDRGWPLSTRLARRQVDARQHQDGADEVVALQDLAEQQPGQQAVVDRDQIHQQAGRAGAEAALDQRIDLVGAERGDDGEEADGEEAGGVPHRRSEEHTSELQSLMRISYAVF